MSEGVLYHSGHVLLLAKRAFERSSTMRSESEVSISLSAAAFEGFLNEVAHSAGREFLGDEGLVLSEVLLEAEEARLQSVMKYRFAIFVLSKRFPKRGDAIIQRLSALVRLRNGLMHVKPEPIFTLDQPADNNQSKSPPAPIPQLLADGALSSPFNQTGTWRQMVAVPSVAKWAYNVAIAGMKSIHEATPDGLLKQIIGFQTADLSELE